MVRFSKWSSCSEIILIKNILWYGHLKRTYLFHILKIGAALKEPSTSSNPRFTTRIKPQKENSSSSLPITGEWYIKSL